MSLKSLHHSRDVLRGMCGLSCVLCGRCERHVSILVEEQVTIALSGT